MEYCRCSSSNKKGMCNEWSIKCIICWKLCTINNNSHNKYEQQQQRSKCVYKVYSKARPMAHNWHTTQPPWWWCCWTICDCAMLKTPFQKYDWRFGFRLQCATQNGIGTKLQTVYQYERPRTKKKYFKVLILRALATIYSATYEHFFNENYFTCTLGLFASVCHYDQTVKWLFSR